MKLILVSLAALVLTANAQLNFGSGTVVGYVDSSEVNEASGLAASRLHPNVLYTHNDGGDPGRIFAIDATDASLIATFGISGADHYDWEDIAVGPCPGNKTCIYIADAGHSSSRKVNMIYMVEEPKVLMDETLYIKNKLPFSWSEDDGQTLLVDNNSEVYMVSNVQGGHGLVAHIPSNGWGATIPVNVTSNTHINISTTHHDPGAGDISPDGTEVLIRARSHVFYWKVQNNDYLTALTTSPTELPSQRESLGEAICWDSAGKNYYTISEGTHKPLFKFVRQPNGPAVG